MKRTIFIVDDDPSFRKTLFDILKIKGYFPVAFGQGQAALADLKDDIPLVALVDLKLEDMSGLVLLEQIKQAAPQVQCILLTGYASQASAIQAINLGAYGYMQKPYDIEQLLVMIHRAVEKLEAEEALRASEERFRQVVVSISDHIYVIEIIATGGYLNRYLSPNFELLTGYPLETQMTDVSFWASEVVYPEDQPTLAGHIARLEQDQADEVEYRIVRADGQVMRVRDSARVQRQGESRLIYGVISDVTARHQLEEQLRQSQKMEAIGQLAGGVAHDFNNILTIIIGNCELILSNPDYDETLYREVQQIQRAGERAASLTRQLLAFSRKQFLQLQSLNLNTIVTDMEKMLRRLIGEDIDLITILDATIKPVRADSGQLEQVLLNLALNARDAMPLGGKLTIETAPIYLDEGYARRHVEVKPGNYVMLAVSDTGVGMDGETQSRIFEPFFTTKEPGKGTGLGLATIYGIVKQGGGHIWVYSELGHGTIVKVYFPQLDENIELDEIVPLPPKPTRQPATILLVEDEAVVRKLTQRILLKEGYTVLEAGNGNEALQLSQKYPSPIDLLLTDVVMPDGISGRQLAERLITQRPKLKVLYMSGYTDDAIIHYGVLDTGQAFLQKPFNSETLLNSVHQVLGSE